MCQPHVTCVGVVDQGGQVGAGAQVHRHKCCVFADDIAGLAGVDSAELEPPPRPCQGRDSGVRAQGPCGLPTPHSPRPSSMPGIHAQHGLYPCIPLNSACCCSCSYFTSPDALHGGQGGHSPGTRVARGSDVWLLLQLDVISQLQVTNSSKTTMLPHA